MKELRSCFYFPIIKNGGVPIVNLCHQLGVPNSPFSLKQFVGGPKTFIRHLQLNLEILDIKDKVGCSCKGDNYL